MDFSSGSRGRSWHLTQVLASPDVGGGEKVALGICKYAQTQLRADEVCAFVPGRSTTWRDALNAGCQVQSFNRDLLFSRSHLLGSAYGMFIAMRLASRPGLVHFHSPFEYGAISRYLNATRSRAILHLHLDYDTEALQWALKRPPRMVIACAEFLEALARKAFPKSSANTDIITIRNAVNTTVFSPTNTREAKRKLGLTPDAPFIVMIANLSPHKGQETAIHAISQVRDQCANLVMWIVGGERGGGSDYTNYLAKTIAEHHLTNTVQLKGFRQDIPEVLRAADIMLLPSKSEGLPLSILEAQACRTLVIAAPTAGIPEIIEDQRTGFLLDADDHKGYAQVITHVLSNRPLHDIIVDAAYRRVVTHHTAEAFHRRIWDAYKSVLGA